MWMRTGPTLYFVLLLVLTSVRSWGDFTGRKAPPIFWRVPRELDESLYGGVRPLALGPPGRQRVQGQHALALFAHFPRSLTVIWQKATLTQRSWEGQEMGVRSKRRNRKSSEVEAERINTWRLRAVCRLTSVGPARPQPREKRCHLTALATIKGRVPWRMGLDTWASNPSLQ